MYEVVEDDMIYIDSKRVKGFPGLNANNKRDNELLDDNT